MRLINQGKSLRTVSLLTTLPIIVFLTGCESTEPVYPDVLSMESPQYPPEAANTSLEGWVQVMYTVTEDGKATDIRIVDREPENTTVFNDACVNTVASATFAPQSSPFHGAQFVCRFQMAEENRCSALPQKISRIRDEGRYAEAMAEIEKILECEDSFVTRIIWAAEVGWTFLAMEYYESAINAFDAALKPRPPAPFVYLGRALAHEAIGNAELAEADFLATYEVGMAVSPEKFLEELETRYAYAQERVLSAGTP